MLYVISEVWRCYKENLTSSCSALITIFLSEFSLNLYSFCFSISSCRQTRDACSFLSVVSVPCNSSSACFLSSSSLANLVVRSWSLSLRSSINLAVNSVLQEYKSRLYNVSLILYLPTSSSTWVFLSFSIFSTICRCFFFSSLSFSLFFSSNSLNCLFSMNNTADSLPNSYNVLHRTYHHVNMPACNSGCFLSQTGCCSCTQHLWSLTCFPIFCPSIHQWHLTEQQNIVGCHVLIDGLQTSFLSW